MTVTLRTTPRRNAIMRAYRSMSGHAARSRVATILVAASALLALAALPAHAQYVYLDANQNGIHDACDVMAAVGPTQFDVWLQTDTNRDGTPAVCGSGVGALDLDHYEIVLHVTGGTVLWGKMQNYLSGASFNFCRDGRDTTDTD